MRSKDLRTGSTVPVKLAANLMGRGEQFVRIGLQRGILPFGVAFANGGVYHYYISPVKFLEYTGCDKAKLYEAMAEWRDASARDCASKRERYEQKKKREAARQRSRRKAVKEEAAGIVETDGD